MSDINSTIGKINSTANTPSATLPVGFHPLHILVRRRWQLFSCLFLVACIALVSAFVYKPVYEAVAQVQVIPPVSETTSNSALAAIKSGGSSDYFKTQCELIQSQHILAQVADRMNLKGDYNGLVNELRDQVIIRPIAGSHLIDVVGMADNKSEAAAISNQLVTAFVDTSLAIQKTNDKRILEKILSQKDKFSKDVERYEKELHDFRQAHFTTDATKSLALVESRILQLENDHNQAQLACIALKARAEDISKSVEGNEGLIGTGLATEAISSDALCTQLKNSLQRLGQDEAKLSQAYLPGHRMLISVRSQISEVKDQLEQRKQKVFENTYANILHGYNEQVRQKETLGSLLKIAKQEGIELTQRSHQYEHIKSNLQLASKLKADHIAQLQQFTLEQEMAEAPVVIVDSARVPTHPKGLSSAHRSASILLIGILFSIAFILSMDRFSVNENTQGMPMDAHAAAAWMTNPMMFWPNGQPVGRYAAPSSPMAVGDVEEVKSALGRIGNIPFQESEKNSRAFSWRSRIVHIDQQSAPAASFRQISTQLLARFGQARQSVVLTGTSRNSGKTTCASNLALLLAQAGRNVVLVDSDPQNSSLQRIFKIDKAKLRLADYNDRSGLLNKSIQKTDVDNLYVVQIDVDPRESSENKTTRLAALNSDLSQHFDWVIYDAGVIGCNTTDQLLQIVGKALFVSTDDDASGRLVTIEQIEHRGAINLGCVENAHTISQTTSRQMAFS